MGEIFFTGLAFWGKLLFFYTPRVLISALVFSVIKNGLIDEMFDFEEFYKDNKFLSDLMFYGGIAFVYYLLFIYKIVTFNF